MNEMQIVNLRKLSIFCMIELHNQRQQYITVYNNNAIDCLYYS